MTKSLHTKNVFDKLKSTHKEYVGFETAHFPLDKKTYTQWGEHVDSFIRGIDG